MNTTTKRNELHESRLRQVDEAIKAGVKINYCDVVARDIKKGTINEKTAKHK